MESELATALQSLDGWEERVLAGERDRIAELLRAWHHQAARIRELDELLGVMTSERGVEAVSIERPLEVSAARERSEAEISLSNTQEPAEKSSTASIASDMTTVPAIAAHERTRQENLRKLKSIRDRLHNDLVTTLCWVRELVTMIHLAKYTGAPASRAEELVKQIAASVEGLSDSALHPITI